MTVEALERAGNAYRLWLLCPCTAGGERKSRRSEHDPFEHAVSLHSRRDVAADIHDLRQHRAIRLLVPTEDNDLRAGLELVLAARRADHYLRLGQAIGWLG